MSTISRSSVQRLDNLRHAPALPHPVGDAWSTRFRPPASRPLQRIGMAYRGSESTPIRRWIKRSSRRRGPPRCRQLATFRVDTTNVSAPASMSAWAGSGRSCAPTWPSASIPGIRAGRWSGRRSSGRGWWWGEADGTNWRHSPSPEPCHPWDDRGNPTCGSAKNRRGVPGS